MLTLLAFVFAQQLNSSESDPVVSTPARVVREEEVTHSDPIGDCEGNGRSFDLRRLMFLENRSVDIEGPNGPLRVSVNRETLRIAAVNGISDRPVFATNIGYAAESHGDIDVELKLGYFDNMLIVYWKETFQNRIYRQGMFRISGENINFLCAGEGGITSRE